MPVSILINYMVSIRPCELNNFAGLFGDEIRMSANHSEYMGMMSYLSYSGASLLEIVESSDGEYQRIKSRMFGRSQVHHFENVLDKSRALILSGKAGSNVIRYLLQTMNNKVIKTQRDRKPNEKLSNLMLQWGCIPFDTMPFASSLLQHNPGTTDLFESINAKGREHELMVRYINANMSINSRLYTPIKELKDFTENIDDYITEFNSKLYTNKRHQGRRLEIFGQSLYVKEAYDNTKLIMEKLLEASQDGVQGYSDAIDAWIDDAKVDSEEKRSILREMLTKSHATLIYGAAGTGKTYIINHITQFFDERDKLFLANTNPAVENLRRKVSNVNNLRVPNHKI